MWWRGSSREDTQGSGGVSWRRYQAEWWARMTPHDRSQHSRACGGLIFRERNISAVSRRIQMRNGQSAPSMRQTFSWTPEGFCSLSAPSPPKWGAGGRERERETEREIMKSSMERGKGKRRNNANKNAPFWSDEGSLKIFYTLLATLKLPLNNSRSLQITVSQTEKDKYHKTSLICVIWKTGTNELV